MRVTVRYETPDENKETRRQRAERFNQADKLPPEADVTSGVEYLWEWFWTLSARRHHDMGQPEPLTYREVGEWSAKTQTAVTPEEVEMLLGMDDAYLRAMKEELAELRQRTTPPPPSGRGRFAK